MKNEQNAQKAHPVGAIVIKRLTSSTAKAVPLPPTLGKVKGCASHLYISSMQLSLKCCFVNHRLFFEGLPSLAFPKWGRGTVAVL